jgi:hypothetical protein
MSTLPISPWNHLCWKDTNVRWNIEELLEIYNDVFSKYDRFYQDPTYRGIAFQGKHSKDHIGAIISGNTPHNEELGTKRTIDKESLGRHLEGQLEYNVRHEDLCVGEFAKILDYLTDLGYQTHRARIMELGPGNHVNWHVDSYEGMWGNNKRYHIPLITNNEAYLVWRQKGQRYFFNPAPDGSGIWVNTDVVHQYINRGDTWRAHIVIDLIKR